MGVHTDATARAIHEVDQRLATLQHARELVDGNTTRLVESITQAITQANEQAFAEAEQQLREEEADILRDERRRAGKEASGE